MQGHPLWPEVLVRSLRQCLLRRPLPTLLTHALTKVRGIAQDKMDVSERLNELKRLAIAHGKTTMMSLAAQWTS